MLPTTSPIGGREQGSCAQHLLMRSHTHAGIDLPSVGNSGLSPAMIRPIATFS